MQFVDAINVAVGDDVLAAERQCTRLHRNTKHLHRIRRKISDLYIAQHQREVVVVESVKTALPVHEKLADMVEHGLKMDAVVAVKSKAFRGQVDVRDLVMEDLWQGVVLVKHFCLVQRQVIDADLPRLRLFDGYGNRIQFECHFGCVTLEQKIKIGGAVGRYNILRV